MNNQDGKDNVNASDEELEASFKRAAVGKPRFQLRGPTFLGKERDRGHRGGRPALIKAKSTPISTTAPSSARWTVKRGKNIPRHFDLERPETISSPAGDVATDVSDCLFQRSIHAKYDNVQAEAICRTFCQTKYVIRLFEGEQPGTTVIEVQRLSGCCVAFKHERDAIIRAAKGEFTPFEKPARLDIPDFLLNMIPPPTEEEIKQTLVSIVKELSDSSNGRDCQISQLELLACMTDRDKSNVKNCHKVSKMIFQGMNNIRDICTNLIDGGADDDMGDTIKLFALLTFANCLDCLEADGSSADVIKSQELWVSNCLYPCLFSCLKAMLEENKCPHTACLVSKCLTPLLKNCPKLRELNDQNDRRDLLKKTVEWGQGSHKKLYQEANAAVAALQS